MVGAGAAVLGDITIGANSRIGANAVVVKTAPANSVVVGVPGQIVTRSKPTQSGASPDLDHTSMPDTLGVALASLLERVETLEQQTPPRPQLQLNGSHPAASHSIEPHGGHWRGEDFSI